MLIDGHTQVFFVLGHPVTQVRAPEVFNPLFQAHGVNAVLLPAEVAPERFEGFVRGALSAANVPGLWLTIPHKTPAVALSEHVDRLGRRAGAVNALRREADGSLRGALFDGLGLSKSLDHFGLAPEGRRVLVLGLGGGGHRRRHLLGRTTPGHAGPVGPRPGPHPADRGAPGRRCRRPGARRGHARRQRL